MPSPVTRPPVTLHKPAPASAPAPAGRTRRRTPWIVAAVVLLVLLAGAGAWAALGGSGSGDDTRAAGSTGPTTAPSTADDSPSPSSPAPATSASPRASRTAAPALPAPFSIGVPMRNLPCTGQYVVMLGTAGDRAIWESKLAASVQGVDGAKLLRGSDSCDAFLERDPLTGDEIYDTYTGPYPTVRDACSALASTPNPRAWIRQLSNPSKQHELCACPEGAASQPEVSGPYDPADLPVRRAMNEAQWVMFSQGALAKEQLNGAFDDSFRASLESLQSSHGLTATGVLDRATWEFLLADYCGPEAYVVTH